MTLKNPYRPGRYVTGPQFYGRQDILHTLEQDDYRGAYIIGTRQMGKTSLLREMERQLRPFTWMSVTWGMTYPGGPSTCSGALTESGLLTTGCPTQG